MPIVNSFSRRVLGARTRRLKLLTQIQVFQHDRLRIIHWAGGLHSDLEEFRGDLIKISPKMMKSNHALDLRGWHCSRCWWGFTITLESNLTQSISDNTRSGVQFSIFMTGLLMMKFSPQICTLMTKDSTHKQYLQTPGTSTKIQTEHPQHEWWKVTNDVYGLKANSIVKKILKSAVKRQRKVTSERDCYVSLGNKSGTRQVQLRKWTKTIIQHDWNS